MSDEQRSLLVQDQGAQSRRGAISAGAIDAPNRDEEGPEGTPVYAFVAPPVRAAFNAHPKPTLGALVNLAQVDGNQPVPGDDEPVAA